MTDDIFKPKLPNNGEIALPDEGEIEEAAKVIASISPLKTDEREATLDFQAKSLVASSGDNAALLASAERLGPLGETGIERTTHRIGEIDDEILKTDPTVQVATNRAARGTQVVDGAAAEFSITRNPSERRSRFKISVLFPVFLGAETYFAATNLQESGLYTHFDQVSGANLVPLIMAIGAVSLAYGLGLQKASVYRHFDDDKARTAYREKLQKQSRILAPLWVVLAAVIFGTAIGFSELGVRAGYADWVKGWIGFWNQFGLVLQAPLALLMILFLATQILAVSIVTASTWLNEEHAYRKVHHVSERENEARVARVEIQARLEAEREQRAVLVATYSGIMKAYAATIDTTKTRIMRHVAEIDAEVSVAAHNALLASFARRGAVKRPTLQVVTPAE